MKHLKLFENFNKSKLEDITNDCILPLLDVGFELSIKSSVIFSFIMKLTRPIKTKGKIKLNGYIENNELVIYDLDEFGNPDYENNTQQKGADEDISVDLIDIIHQINGLSGVKIRFSFYNININQERIFIYTLKEDTDKL